MRLVREDARGRRVGRIVEVEAYIGEDDRASHARFGRTARNAPMYGPPGIAYVYLVYGMYDCLNVVTEDEGRPAAVLIRAVEPLEGAAAMRDARAERPSPRSQAQRPSRGRERLAALPQQRLASGPGLVCAAFSVDRSDSGRDLCDAAGSLRLEAPTDDVDRQIVASSRIGVGYAGEPWAGLPWRFALAGNPSVSR